MLHSDAFDVIVTENIFIDILSDEAMSQIQGDLLEKQRVYLPNGKEIGFSIDLFSKRRLLQGVDELSFLMSTSHRF